MKNNFKRRRRFFFFSEILWSISYSSCSSTKNVCRIFQLIWLKSLIKILILIVWNWKKYNETQITKFNFTYKSNHQVLIFHTQFIIPQFLILSQRLLHIQFFMLLGTQNKHHDWIETGEWSSQQLICADKKHDNYAHIEQEV